MSMGRRLVLIIPYYGRWPSYFGYYLQSLRGRCFDLLLVTDLPLDGYDVPSNVKVVRLPLAALRELAERKIGTSVVLQSPIRLCDFKPMYGKIFEDHIRDYGYWAFGDCDLVYGRAFDGYLSGKLSEGFDALSLCRMWPTGSFFALRNCEMMNRFYERTNNWREICNRQEDTFVNYDEIGGEFYQQVASGQMTLEDCSKIRDSFGAALARAKDIRLLAEDVHTETNLVGQVVEMNDGRLTIDGREIPIFHFVNCKGRRYFRCAPLPKSGCERYWIADTGVYLGKGAWRWRGLISRWRKLVALCGSLRQHGLTRIYKRDLCNGCR